MPSFAQRIGVVLAISVTACQGDKTVAVAPPSSFADGPAGPSALILPSPPAGSSTSIFVRDSVQLASQLSTKHGRTITWSSSSSSVVHVTGKGLATALAVGSATITASNSNGTERWTFSVAKRIASITVTPNPVSVAAGATVLLSVALKASDGTAITGRPVSYQSLNSAVATVSAAGMVLGVTTGSTSVVVTAGTTGNIVSSTIPVTIGATTPPPDSGAVGVNAALARAVFPANNPWNTRIDTATVDPNSAAIVANIGLTTSLHPDFGANLGGSPFGIPYVVVKGTQARVNVTFDFSDESDAGPYPIPVNPPIEAGGDAHILIVDKDNWKLYELFAAQHLADGSWHAGSGAIFDLSSNALRPAGWTSADAAGLPILPGLVRFDEVSAGAISHALRFTVSRSRRAYISPARHWASSDTSSLKPPMGMRVRLKAGVNISGYPASAQVILRALKTYGMIVADNGSNWFLSGVADSRWNDTEINTLKGLKGSDFEVVRMTGVVTH
ncbi:MAG: Ig-like domain-containing protein [bacterium]